MNDLKLAKQLFDEIGHIRIVVNDSVKFGLNPEDCALIQLADKYEDFIIQYIKGLLDDRNGWVEWFIYDNDFGVRGFQASVQDTHLNVRTVDDLQHMIRLDNENPLTH